ncbi:hypothetical protein ACI4BF_28410, partial [Klebsiella pneumoniae]|uniref:hypothetical protein n=1 Tax=Klebsiella pneumoniae TaxID=573 RepID=UPI003853972E
QLRILRKPTVEEKFALEEVRGKIQSAFEKENLGKLKFEFAILNANDDYEMLSNDFEKEFWDTTNNKRFFIAIVPNDPDPEINQNF